MATTTQNTGKGGDAVIAKLVKKGMPLNPEELLATELTT